MSDIPSIDESLRQRVILLSRERDEARVALAEVSRELSRTREELTYWKAQAAAGSATNADASQDTPPARPERDDVLDQRWTGDDVTRERKYAGPH